MMKDGMGAADGLSMVLSGKGKLGVFDSVSEGKVNMKVELFNSDGVRKDIRKVHNTVTNAGKYGTIDQILATPTLDKPTHMELGEGTGGTTKLNDYIAGSRTVFDSKTRADAVVTMVTTFPAGTGTGAITEAGVFDSASEDSVNMWMYATFAVVNKLATDSLVITWTLTQG